MLILVPLLTSSYRFSCIHFVRLSLCCCVCVCMSRCPVYAELPSFCTLVADPASSCCRQPRCVVDGKVVTNAVPIGTVTVTGGNSGTGTQLTGTGKRKNSGPSLNRKRLHQKNRRIDPPPPPAPSLQFLHHQIDGKTKEPVHKQWLKKIKQKISAGTASLRVINKKSVFFHRILPFLYQ